MKNRVCLAVLDGWGLGENLPSNAITQARTPFYDSISADQHSIQASGTFVGLPAEQFGNSDIGHLTLGAGRVIACPLIQIQHQCKDAISPILSHQEGAYHLVILASPGGIHSHIKHLLMLMDVLIAKTQAPIYLHLISDGRDRPAKALRDDLQVLTPYLQQERVHIASLSGRYYAMDRDNNWERTHAGAQVMIQPSLQKIDLQTVLQQHSESGLSDEFLVPTALDNPGISAHDCVIFCNYRADRMLQLTSTFKERLPNNPYFSFGKYPNREFLHCLFPPQTVNNSLGEVLSQHQLKQLRIAETEKFAHVTFFFNGGENIVFPGEERILIPSPKVSTFDLQPAMSAPGIAQTLSKHIRDKTHDFYLCNIANADMVGHTGNLEACTQAVEAADQALAEIDKACSASNTTLLITADHGNADCMQYMDGTPCTTHTHAPVPLILRHSSQTLQTTPESSLADVAPTVLALMGLASPEAMTGKVLLK